MLRWDDSFRFWYDGLNEELIGKKEKLRINWNSFIWNSKLFVIILDEREKIIKTKVIK